MEGTGLPKNSLSFLELVVKLQEKSGREKLLKLKASDPYKDEVWDSQVAQAAKKRRRQYSLSEISVH